MVQNKRSRLILDATYVTYLGTERINGTVRVLFKTRLIFSRINGPNDKNLNYLLFTQSILAELTVI